MARKYILSADLISKLNECIEDNPIKFLTISKLFRIIEIKTVSVNIYMLYLKLDFILFCCFQQHFHFITAHRM